MSSVEKAPPAAEETATPAPQQEDVADEEAPPPVKKSVPLEDALTKSSKLVTAIQQLESDTLATAELGFDPSEGKESLQQKFRQAAMNGRVNVMKAMLEMSLVDINCAHETVSFDSHFGRTEKDDEMVFLDPANSFAFELRRRTARCCILFS